VYRAVLAANLPLWMMTASHSVGDPIRLLDLLMCGPSSCGALFAVDGAHGVL